MTGKTVGLTGAITTFDLGCELIRAVDAERELSQAFPEFSSGQNVFARTVADLGEMFAQRRRRRNAQLDAAGPEWRRPLPAPVWDLGSAGKP